MFVVSFSTAVFRDPALTPFPPPRFLLPLLYFLLPPPRLRLPPCVLAFFLHCVFCLHCRVSISAAAFPASAVVSPASVSACVLAFFLHCVFCLHCRVSISAAAFPASAVVSPASVSA
ncbi:hypothetical protein, partial [Alistipes finegoldii]|uniref:hypothetical protein n=1 Tax=Alistipes finegoldii TaxID=214856 RepID=UPI00266674CB